MLSTRNFEVCGRIPECLNWQVLRIFRESHRNVPSRKIHSLHILKAKNVFFLHITLCCTNCNCCCIHRSAITVLAHNLLVVSDLTTNVWLKSDCFRIISLLTESLLRTAAYLGQPISRFAIGWPTIGSELKSHCQFMEKDSV